MYKYVYFLYTVLKFKWYNLLQYSYSLQGYWGIVLLNPFNLLKN